MTNLRLYKEMQNSEISVRSLLIKAIRRMEQPKIVQRKVCFKKKICSLIEEFLFRNYSCVVICVLPDSIEARRCQMLTMSGRHNPTQA